MAATIRGGWLTVPYDGHDTAVVYVALTRGAPDDDDWQPAFLDYAGDERVAKIPAPADVPPRTTAYSRVGGHVVKHGRPGAA